MIIIETFNYIQTLLLGIKIAKQINKNQIYSINGNIGSGKTIIVKGIGKGLGIKSIINSPTFQILKIYNNNCIPFYHFDFYRIRKIKEIKQIEYEKYFFKNNICCIEWPKLINRFISEYAIEIFIRHNIKKINYRKIIINKINFKTR